jgi:catechol 2,3-dioxygenase-like lactoylglutathione lyase family enzyme
VADAAPPRVTGVLETGIYVEDVARSRAFYEEIFGFEAVFSEDRICTLAVAPAQVLILFKRGGTLEPVPVGDGFIPPHDSSGPQHFAFAIAQNDMDAWKRHLAGNGVPVESEVSWPQGGKSLYFRDPDGLLVELATPGLWANY